MRLSTAEPRDRERAISVIHAALDAGIRLLDTADAYALDASDTGHNERLVAEAVRTWAGDRTSIRIATKGGLRRPRGGWVPDGRAKHLRAACEASRDALGVDSIDLYQLHAVDPRTPLETSVRALAALQEQGVIRAIGLCNVNVSQIETARAITPIAAVQVELGIVQHDALRGGVAEYCRDEGIMLLAWRPLGGTRAARIAKDPVLRAVAERHDATPHELALAWLLDLDPCVVPLAGATRVETAASLGRAAALRLDADDRALLDDHLPAGRILRIPQSRRRPPDDAAGEVVLVMGMPAAGKSTVARKMESDGWARLNRDARGGRVRDLVGALDEGLRAGRRRWVLDNTYPTRAARNEVIECAWRHGVPVRCIHVATPLARAQVQAVERMLDAHGALPQPGELRARGRTDTRFFGPDAQFRWLREAELPVAAEGFTRIDEVVPENSADAVAGARGLFIEYDGGILTDADGGISPTRRVHLEASVRAGWRLIALAWRPDVGDDAGAAAALEASFADVRHRLRLDLDIRYCPHAAGPPVCWCRRPLPGLVLAAARTHGLALAHSLIVGRPPVDRTLAERLGMSFRTLPEFFDAPA